MDRRGFLKAALVGGVGAAVVRPKCRECGVEALFSLFDKDALCADCRRSHRTVFTGATFGVMVPVTITWSEVGSGFGTGWGVASVEDGGYEAYPTMTGISQLDTAWVRADSLRSEDVYRAMAGAAKEFSADGTRHVHVARGDGLERLYVTPTYRYPVDVTYRQVWRGRV